MKTAKALAMAFAGFVCICLLTEAAYRIFRGGVPIPNSEADQLCVPDPVLGYRFKPGTIAPQGRDVNCINNVGFRGNDVVVPKPDNIYRIICVGDSATNGVNVKNKETFPAMLGEMFAKSNIYNGMRVEVINAGVPGYLSDHHLEMFDDIYRKLQPDMMVFMMGVTDVSSVVMNNETWDAIRRVKRKIGFFPDSVEELFQDISSAYYHLSRQVRDYMEISALKKNEKKDYSKEIKAALETYVRNYQTLVDKCKALGIAVVNVNYPWNFTERVGREDNFEPLKDVIKYYEFNLYWQAMPLLGMVHSEFASKNGIYNIDVQGDVLRSRNRLLFYGKGDFSHPSLQGNFLIASKLYLTLSDSVMKDKIVSRCDGFEFAFEYLLGLSN